MRKVKILILRISIFSLLGLIMACAPLTPQPETQIKARVTEKAGDVVYLFHGGNKTAKEEFCLDDVVPVYRYFGKQPYKQKSKVGMIQVTKYVNDHYIKGVVVEGGIIMDGDIAIKPNSACMISLPEPENK